MDFLRTLSKILALPPIITFFYDLINEWVNEFRFNIRTLDEWGLWLDKEGYESFKLSAQGFISEDVWDKWTALPAPVALAIPPVILYVIYRIWFTARGGKRTGAFTYKSRD